jgi:single-stranded-DNA-specific exonuclease
VTGGARDAGAAPAPGGRHLSGREATLESMDESTPWALVPADPPAAGRLAEAIGVPHVVGHLLLRRGVRSPEEGRRFLEPTADGLHDPSLLLGAGEASDLLVSTARRGGRIVVFGDYDVDGVTAVAQLKAALGRIGADVHAFIPHRLRDGYGLRPETVLQVLADLSPAAIVTVDCGITAAEGVACAREAGVDVVVTDHHLVPDELPRGAVVVNPRQPGCSYPFKDLAASGIALKMAEAVARRGKVALSRQSLLRAAALGTIADLVPLQGENRTIASTGLEALAAARGPGLRALLAEAGVEAGVAPTSEEVAFRIAPRLNAAGRLDTAALALALFEERDGARAASIARELSLRNAGRQALERRVVSEAKARLEERGGAAGLAVIIEADPGWHRGVLGIAASRLAREYHRPVLLFGLDGEKARGSGRSIPEVPLHAILKSLAHHFLEFGGHSQAVGATLPADRFPSFREEARAVFAERVPAEALRRREEAELELPLERVDENLASALARLEPHGAGNPRPVFLARSVLAAGGFLAAGERGLRGRLRTPRGSLRCIAWQPAADLSTLAARGRPFDILYRLTGDRRYGIQVEVLASRPARSAA